LLVVVAVVAVETIREMVVAVLVAIALTTHLAVAFLRPNFLEVAGLLKPRWRFKHLLLIQLPLVLEALDKAIIEGLTVVILYLTQLHQLEAVAGVNKALPWLNLVVPVVAVEQLHQAIQLPVALGQPDKDMLEATGQSHPVKQVEVGVVPEQSEPQLPVLQLMVVLVGKVFGQT
jgi:hypothetical protein